MKVQFPFQYITTNRFGKIFRPYASIAVFKKDVGIYIERILVVDTGADLTIFPRKDAYLFGVNLETETIQDKTIGIGGEERMFLYKNLPIKIGATVLKIPVGFLNRNDVPALLGRQQCLEFFSLCLKTHITTIEKE